MWIYWKPIYVSPPKKSPLNFVVNKHIVSAPVVTNNLYFLFYIEQTFVLVEISLKNISFTFNLYYE